MLTQVTNLAKDITWLASLMTMETTLREVAVTGLQALGVSERTLKKRHWQFVLQVGPLAVLWGVARWTPGLSGAVRATAITQLRSLAVARLSTVIGDAAPALFGRATAAIGSAGTLMLAASRQEREPEDEPVAQAAVCSVRPRTTDERPAIGQRIYAPPAIRGAHDYGRVVQYDSDGDLYLVVEHSSNPERRGHQLLITRQRFHYLMDWNGVAPRTSER